MKQFFLIITIVFSLGTYAQKDTIRVYYLGGQSNMQGYGYVKDLPKSLLKKHKNVFIFQGNPVSDNDPKGGLGKWETLQPGHGTGFASDGVNTTLSDRFGIELSLAAELSKRYPNQKIAFIKYARNGSSIDSSGTHFFGAWDPDLSTRKTKNQYDFFLKTVQQALAVKDIDQDGKEDVLLPCGILWMQGESDADKTEQVAQNYYNNLKHMMQLMRATFRNNSIPIIIGKISDSGNDPDGKVWDYGELVQYAQEKLAKSLPYTSIVRNTLQYKYSDKYHYTSQGYIDLGIAFAKALQEWETKK